MAQSTQPNYIPSRAPQVDPKNDDLTSLARYLDRELRAIANTFNDMTSLDLRQIDVPPLRPRAGMIVFADGVHWNPGSGKGTYAFDGSVWKFLG